MANIERTVLICENNKKEAKNEENEIWFYLVDELYAMLKEIKPEVSNDKVVYYADLRDSLSIRIKDILERMCSYVGMKEIINVSK